MSIKATLLSRQAVIKQQKGEPAEALRLFDEAMQAGLNDPRSILSYSVLLIRDGQYQKARELLIKIQKSPALSEEQRRQLFVNYSVCVYKMGEIDKGVELLERLHQKNPSGLIYETLGYLYVETGDTDKALSYNAEAVEYDDEDAISLDNLAQTYYRLVGDKAKAKEYFDKAIAIKPGQIDTLYFLSQYDIESGDKAAAKEKLERALDGRFSPLNYADRAKVQAMIDTL